MKFNWHLGLSFFLKPIALTSISLILIFNLELGSTGLKLASYSFYLLAALGCLLAFTYGWANYVLAFVLLAASYWFSNEFIKLATFSPSHQQLLLRPTTAYALLCFYLPLVFLYIGWLKPNAQLIKKLLTSCLTLAFFFLIGWLCLQAYPLQITNLLTVSFIPSLLIPGLGISQLAQVIFLVSWLLLLIKFIKKPTYFTATSLIAMPLVLFSLQGFYLANLPLLTFLTGLIIFFLALLEDIFALAFIDELTQIPARRALNKRLAELGKNFSLAMADVDHFKKFNDTNGHDKGDEVLKLVANYLSQVKGGGKAYRYGGEEFTLVFKGKTAQEALVHIEAIRETIAKEKLNLGPDNKDVSVTLSFGLAEYKDELASTEAVIKAADTALYQAKKAGRNKTCIAK